MNLPPLLSLFPPVSNSHDFILIFELLIIRGRKKKKICFAFHAARQLGGGKGAEVRRFEFEWISKFFGSRVCREEGSVKQIYPVSNMSAALSQWFKVLYNFRYGGRAPLPSPPLPVPAGLFHCVSRISILRSLDLNRLTGELSGITVSRFINVVNLVSKCFLARVWCLYLSLSHSVVREEKIGRFSSTGK